MAIVTFLFSFLARKAGDLIQAVFGWSVNALFGRLPRRAQIMVTGALLLSLAWPFFVVGVFVPKLAAWALAFLPLDDVIGESALRAIWITLAVTSPLLVGLLVWLAAPKRTGSAPRAMISGYLTALGFFIASVIVLITIPILKIASIARRWSDEHVYVQPHDQRYEQVVHALAEACARAGITPRIEDAPQHMVLATSVMRTFARGAVAPFVGEKLRRVAGDGVELYLYPSDLLLRGDKNKVARIRAMLTRTRIDHHAYLVGDAEAQRIQAELSRLDDNLDRDDGPAADHQIVLGLKVTYAQLMAADMPFADWAIIDGLARKLERRLVGARVVQPDDLPIDQVGDQLQQIEKTVHRADEHAPAWIPQGPQRSSTARVTRN